LLLVDDDHRLGASMTVVAAQFQLLLDQVAKAA
jgi:hypothetical protein